MAANARMDTGGGRAKWVEGQLGVETRQAASFERRSVIARVGTSKPRPNKKTSPIISRSSVHQTCGTGSHSPLERPSGESVFFQA